ncbi:hypothetical protein [Psychroserpens mesophilus]|uniref:hypothetical protein n=1 Tax=Psychroserpens mesophilus TaxID=325473 RepID=UPI00058CE48C|nr:hypothetical protein [Psychroserpens mesophilus]
MNLKQSMLIAVALSLLSLVAWECYWRAHGKLPDIDDNKDLWAVQRAKVETLSKEDVVLMGSSRVLFDIQLNEWEKETGIRPIQLATAGASPLPIFHDIVNNTDYIGTVIVGVTPGLFFSTTFPEAGPWKRAQTRVEHYENRTYAQRINHCLSMPLQKHLVFISTSEEGWSDDIDLKSLLNSVSLGAERLEKPQFPPFYKFEYMDENRNVRMSDKTANDTAFARTVKNVWQSIVEGNDRPPQKKETTQFFVEDAKKFKARGGNLILLRCPSTGLFKDIESKHLARTDFWQELVKATEAKAYHYADYESLKNLDCPEWSHLSGPDASFFTAELVKIMKADGALTNSKTN